MLKRKNALDIALSADSLLQCVDENATLEPEPVEYIGGPRLAPRVMVLPRGVEVVERSSKVQETKPFEGVHSFEEAHSDAMLEKQLRVNKSTLK